MEITKFSEPLNKGTLNQPRFGRKKRRTGQGEGGGGGTLERRALTNLRTAPAPTNSAPTNSGPAPDPISEKTEFGPTESLEPLEVLDVVLRACAELEAVLDPELLVAGEDWLQRLINLVKTDPENTRIYQDLEAAGEQYFWNSDMEIIRQRMTEMARFPAKNYSVVEMEPHFLALKMHPPSKRWGDIEIKLRRGAPKQASQTEFAKASKTLRDLIKGRQDRINAGKLELELDAEKLSNPLAYLQAVAEQLGDLSQENYISPIDRVDFVESVEVILSSYQLTRGFNGVATVLNAAYAAYWLLRDVEALADYHRVMRSSMPSLVASSDASEAAKRLRAWVPTAPARGADPTINSGEPESGTEKDQSDDKGTETNTDDNSLSADSGDDTLTGGDGEDSLGTDHSNIQLPPPSIGPGGTIGPNEDNDPQYVRLLKLFLKQTSLSYLTLENDVRDQKVHVEQPLSQRIVIDEEADLALFLNIARLRSRSIEPKEHQASLVHHLEQNPTDLIDKYAQLATIAVGSETWKKLRRSAGYDDQSEVAKLETDGAMGSLTVYTTFTSWIGHFFVELKDSKGQSSTHGFYPNYPTTEQLRRVRDELAPHGASVAFGERTIKEIMRSAIGPGIILPDYSSEQGRLVLEKLVSVRSAIRTSIPLSDDQLQSARKFVEMFDANQERYFVLYNNCHSFAEGVLQSTGYNGDIEDLFPNEVLEITGAMIYAWLLDWEL